ANLAFISRIGLCPDIISRIERNLLLGTSAAGLLSWVVGIVLLAANRELYMIMEGYGKYNPAQLIHERAKKRYREITKRLDSLNQSYDAFRGGRREFPEEKIRERNLLM